MQYEDNLKKSFEKEEDRSLRYRRLLDAEMNRRWQQQAGKQYNSLRCCDEQKVATTGW